MENDGGTVIPSEPQTITMQTNGGTPIPSDPQTKAMEEVNEIAVGKIDWRGMPARKGKHGGVSTCWFILVTVGLESVASLSLAVNLIIYLTAIMHINLADASNYITNYMGTSYIVSVAIAVCADTFMGRYKTALLSAAIEFLGLVLLTIQAHKPGLKPPPCNIFEPFPQCRVVEGRNAALLFSALYLVAIGSAGIKATLPVHGADQFDEADPKEAKQMSSYFNWLLLSVCLGAAVSLTLLVWVQNNKGWDKGFGISAGAMFLAFAVFLVSVPWFRIPVVRGTNALLEIGQVYAAAFTNRKLTLPENPEELYEISRVKGSAEVVEFVAHRDQFRFLDKAAIPAPTAAPEEGSGRPAQAWKFYRVTQVENAKTVLGMLPILASTVLMSTCLAQLQTFSVQQGATMDTRIFSAHVKVPPATLPIIPVSFMIVVIPLYDRLFVPFARRITGHPTGITHLQRIGVGLVLSCLSMAAAALVETKRKKVAESHGMLDAIPMLQPLPISCLWLSIQYFIFGIADMFTYVGLLEFFYSQAPTPLKSISTSFLWSSMSVGYFLSSILVQVVNAATKNNTRSGGWLHGNNINRNHLNLFYWLLCILSFLNFLNYLFWAKLYKYRPQEKDDSGKDEKV